MGVGGRGLVYKDHDGYIFYLRPFYAGIVQELCESRGGRPGLSILISVLVSVDIKIY